MLDILPRDWSIYLGDDVTVASPYLQEKNYNNFFCIRTPVYCIDGLLVSKIKLTAIF